MKNLKSKMLPLKAIVFVTLLVSSVVYGHMSGPHEFEGEVVTEDFQALSLEELKSQYGEEKFAGWCLIIRCTTSFEIEFESWSSASLTDEEDYDVADDFFDREVDSATL